MENKVNEIIEGKLNDIIEMLKHIENRLHTADFLAKRIGEKDDTKPVCAFCHSEVWDNTKRKLSEKSPDYKCKKCGAGAWQKQDGELYWKK